MRHTIGNKLGIHSSTYRLLVYKNAKAQELYTRHSTTKLGLIKYVVFWWWCPSGWCATHSQVGLSQIPTTEGFTAYTKTTNSSTGLSSIPDLYMTCYYESQIGCRTSLLYQTSPYVDIYKALDDIAREPQTTPGRTPGNKKRYAKLADAFTPLAKV